MGRVLPPKRIPPNSTGKQNRGCNDTACRSVLVAGTPAGEVDVRRGKQIILSVHSDNADWTKRAKEILERTGAQDISSTGEAAVNYVRSGLPLSLRMTPRRNQRCIWTEGAALDDIHDHQQ